MTNGDDSETTTDIKHFWNSVAFFDYIVEDLAGPRIAPTERMWAVAHQPLAAHLAALRPTFCRSRLSRLGPAGVHSGVCVCGRAAGAWCRTDDPCDGIECCQPDTPSSRMELNIHRLVSVGRGNIHIYESHRNKRRSPSSTVQGLAANEGHRERREQSAHFSSPTRPEGVRVGGRRRISYYRSIEGSMRR
jgi:hypothetical protein